MRPDIPAFLFIIAATDPVMNPGYVRHDFALAVGALTAFLLVHGFAFVWRLARAVA